MAEREAEQEDHFNLLPFIAILMCVLGTELLVTMSMATISLGVGAGEGWVAVKDPSRATKNPVLIEWDGQAATVHRAGTRQQIPITFEGTGASGEVQGFLTEMEQKRQTDYALFAVRPSGFANYHRLAALFRSHNIDVGYEPIEQGKKVSLAKNGGKK